MSERVACREAARKRGAARGAEDEEEGMEEEDFFSGLGKVRSKEAKMKPNPEINKVAGPDIRSN